MTDKKAQGRSNRTRGHFAERAVARWLREHGYPDAATTRQVLGHDGTRQPGDVVGPVGLVISVKDVAGSSWPSWCRQAEAEAGDRAWVVVRRKRGTPAVGQWPCLMSTAYGTTVALGARSGMLTTFAEYIAWFDGPEVGATAVREDA